VRASSYPLGKEQRELSSDVPSHDDSLYASQRLDDLKIEGRRYKHCVFANVSFKNVDISECTFEDCVFSDCYFRGAKFTRCTLKASKFIACDLGKAELRQTQFSYCDFEDCYFPYREMAATMPPYDNVRGHLCTALGRQAYLAGDTRDSESYRQCAALAYESHLKKAFTNSGSWYQEHFKGWRRVSALFAYAASRVRGWVWGYRRSYLTVGRNLLIVTLGLFPLLLWWVRAGILSNGQPIPTTYSELIALSWKNVFQGVAFTSVQYLSVPAMIVDGLEDVIGLLLLGLIVSLLFRSVFERWRVSQPWERWR
jgi:hypothetical protein